MGEREYSAMSDELRRGKLEDGVMVDSSTVECRLIMVSVQWGVTGVPMGIVEVIIRHGPALMARLTARRLDLPEANGGESSARWVLRDCYSGGKANVTVGIQAVLSCDSTRVASGDTNHSLKDLFPALSRVLVSDWASLKGTRMPRRTAMEAVLPGQQVHGSS